MNLQPYLLGKFGARIEKHDAEWAIPCPFCDVSRPKGWRLWFNVKKNKGTCYKCHRGFDALKLVRVLEDLSLAEAIAFLKENVGIGSGVTMSALASKVHGFVNAPAESEEIDLPTIALPDEFKECRRLSRASWPSYVTERITDEAAIDRHRIGWCSRGFYAQRLIIPIIFDGVVRSFVARDMTGKAEKKVLYPKGTKTSRMLFNYDHAKKRSRVMLVESVLDAIAAGPLAMAVFGTSLSATQVGLLLASRAQEIAFVFDGDLAGREGAADGVESLRPHGRRLRVVNLADGKDPDDYPRSALLSLVRRSPFIGRGDVSSYVRGALRRL